MISEDFPAGDICRVWYQLSGILRLKTIMDGQLLICQWTSRFIKRFIKVEKQIQGKGFNYNQSTHPVPV